MLIYPNIYIKRVEEITIEMLQKNKIKALILDIDNTLIDYEENMEESVKQWAKDLKGQGTKLIILSNTNKKNKVEKVAKTLEIPYIYFAKKPLKSGFKKAKDQIFTDIIGGNRCKMFTILVEPIKEKDFWYTAWKRPIENKIKNNFIQKQTKEKK